MHCRKADGNGRRKAGTSCRNAPGPERTKPVPAPAASRLFFDSAAHAVFPGEIGPEGGHELLRVVPAQPVPFAELFQILFHAAYVHGTRRTYHEHAVFLPKFFYIVAQFVVIGVAPGQGVGEGLPLRPVEQPGQVRPASGLRR